MSYEWFPVNTTEGMIFRQVFILCSPGSCFRLIKLVISSLKNIPVHDSRRYTWQLYVVSESGTEWALEKVDTLGVTPLIPDGSIIASPCL